MTKNLYAFTATNSIYPEFISINKKEDGKVYISVRSPKKFDSEKGYEVQGDIAEIELPQAEINKMIEALNNDYPACSKDPNNCPENEGFGCCEKYKKSN